VLFQLLFLNEDAEADALTNRDVGADDAHGGVFIAVDGGATDGGR